MIDLLKIVGIVASALALLCVLLPPAIQIGEIIASKLRWRFM